MDPWAIAKGKSPHLAAVPPGRLAEPAGSGHRPGRDDAPP